MLICFLRYIAYDLFPPKVDQSEGRFPPWKSLLSCSCCYPYGGRETTAQETTVGSFATHTYSTVYLQDRARRARNICPFLSGKYIAKLFISRTGPPDPRCCVRPFHQKKSLRLLPTRYLRMTDELLAIRRPLNRNRFHLPSLSPDKNKLVSTFMVSDHSRVR